MTSTRNASPHQPIGSEPDFGTAVIRLRADGEPVATAAIVIGCLLVLTALLLAQPSLATDVRPFPAVAGRIVALDPRFGALVAPDAELEVVANGHRWVEGPAWNRREGFLVFSDIPANVIQRLEAPGEVSVFLTHSGYSGAAPFAGREPGSNGLHWDSAGRLLICQHGDRRIIRLESDGRRAVLIERYAGRRLNSPNDVVQHSSGDLYFTDPPFGLPGTFEDPARELDVNGVYRLRTSGELELLIGDIEAPNGIAFAPDESSLYLTDVGATRPAWLEYQLDDAGRVTTGRIFADAGPWMSVRRGGPDGLETDAAGNVFAAGPEAVFVFAADGTLLGLIDTGVPTANVEWGEDGHTLFIAADTRIYRLRTRTSGRGFAS